MRWLPVPELETTRERRLAQLVIAQRTATLVSGAALWFGLGVLVGSDWRNTTGWLLSIAVAGVATAVAGVAGIWERRIRYARIQDRVDEMTG